MLVQANTVLVMPAYRHAANRVLQRHAKSSTAAPTTDGHTMTTAANPLRPYQVVESRLAYRRHHRRGRGRRRRPSGGGSWAISQGLRLHGELADHRDPGARRTARPSSARTSSCGSRPASAAPRRLSIPATSSRAPASSASSAAAGNERRRDWGNEGIRDSRRRAKHGCGD